MLCLDIAWVCACDSFGFWLVHDQGLWKYKSLSHAAKQSPLWQSYSKSLSSPNVLADRTIFLITLSIVKAKGANFKHTYKKGIIDSSQVITESLKEHFKRELNWIHLILQRHLIISCIGRSNIVVEDMWSQKRVNLWKGECLEMDLIVIYLWLRIAQQHLWTANTWCEWVRKELLSENCVIKATLLQTQLSCSAPYWYLLMSPNSLGFLSVILCTLNSL